ncbi:AmpG family muropeptide MFS transporter, partial [Desulfosarcina sp.]|uniref:AmpG family muropeptide MFS transporter n=1 Tax=Desulfosarcina sp. TaxID=2027861 RepID=UPI003970C110
MTTAVKSRLPKRSWSEATAALIHPRAITMLFLGFSAGLPILLIFSTLSVWLREAGVERGTVTFFSWAALGYSFKFAWAPLVDRLPFPYLTLRMGRRRGWLLVSQIALASAMLWTSFFDPQQTLTMTAVGAVFIGFSSATQDIVIDAYRIESAAADMQSMLSSMYIAGYRIGMLMAGAGSLWLADWWGNDTYDVAVWAKVYRVMAAMMIVGITTTLVIREPVVRPRKTDAFRSNADYLRFMTVFVLAIGTFIAGFFLSRGLSLSYKALLTDTFGILPQPAGFLTETARLAFSIVLSALITWIVIRMQLVTSGHIRETYIDPVADFFRRYGPAALIIIALIGTYRISDILMGVIANVFYIDIGFTKSQIATYTKFWGLLATIGGGFIGGILSLRYGLLRTLFLGALLSAATNVLFAYLAGQGPDELLLFMVIVADNGS